jgi:hypothetical protein
MILITFSLCNNKMTRASLDIKDVHDQKIKEEKVKQRPSQSNQRLTAAIAPQVMTTP